MATVVFALAVLFDDDGSLVDVAALAVLVMTVPVGVAALTLTTKVKIALADAASDAIEQFSGVVH